jgi:hypothetical protein
LLANQKNQEDHNLRIYADIVRSLGIGKIAAHNIKENQGIEEIRDQIRVHLHPVRDISNIVII